MHQCVVRRTDGELPKGKVGGLENELQVSIAATTTMQIIDPMPETRRIPERHSSTRFLSRPPLLPDELVAKIKTVIAAPVHRSKTRAETSKRP